MFKDKLIPKMTLNKVLLTDLFNKFLILNFVRILTNNLILQNRNQRMKDKAKVKILQMYLNIYQLLFK